MRKIEAVYLLCVFIFAALVAARTVTHATAHLPGGAATVPAAINAAGESRAVDLSEVQRLIERGVLSDHEAEFYEPLGPSTSRSERNATPEDQRP